jgi:tetratricopeptide (TPR) repeat protein
MKNVLLLTALAFCSLSTSMGQDIVPAEHSFLRDVRSKKSDGLLVFLPPAGGLATQVRSLYTTERIQKLVPDCQILFLQPDNLAPDEAALTEKYRLGESASVVLIDCAGRPYAADLGVAQSEASLEKFLSDALKTKQKRDSGLEQPRGRDSSISGMDTALASLPAAYWVPFYEEHIQTIIRLAASDKPELAKKYTEFLQRNEKETQVKKLLTAVYKEINAEDSTVDDFLAAFDKELARRQLPPESKQLAEMHRFRYLANARRYEQALKCLDAAHALAPNTVLAGNIPKFRERIQAAMSAKKGPHTPPEPNSQSPQETPR